MNVNNVDGVYLCSFKVADDDCSCLVPVGDVSCFGKIIDFQKEFMLVPMYEIKLWFYSVHYYRIL